MKKVLLLCLCVLILILACGCQNTKNSTEQNKASYTIIDEYGTEVHFKKAPKRILTTAMSLDGIILGLCGEGRLVAINALADDPSSSNIVTQAKKITQKVRNPSQEEIIALHPDVVFAYDWTSKDLIQNVRNFGIPVVVMKGPKTIADVKKNIRTVAKALQISSQGEALVNKMDIQLQDIHNKLASLHLQQKKKIVLISLMTTYGGEGCLFDDICKEAGVINGLSAAGLKNGQPLTKEMLVKINPDVLLMPVYNDHGKFDIEKYNEEYLTDPALQTLGAVKEKLLLYPREGFVYNASQDVVFGVRELAYLAYGDIFKQPDNAHLSVGE